MTYRGTVATKTTIIISINVPTATAAISTDIGKKHQQTIEYNIEHNLRKPLNNEGNLFNGTYRSYEKKKKKTAIPYILEQAIRMYIKRKEVVEKERLENQENEKDAEQGEDQVELRSLEYKRLP